MSELRMLVAAYHEESRITVFTLVKAVEFSNG